MERYFKKLSLLLILPLLFQVSYAKVTEEFKKGVATTHRMMSCNIRVALDEDEANGVGWSIRKYACIEVIKSYNPDIICLQEVLRIQNEDFKKAFSDFIIFGFDGPEMDKYYEGYHGIAKNVILVSKERYEFVAAGNYWLSETPLIAGSQSWGTGRARHCNWIRVKDKATGKEFRILNLHLDHVSKDAREGQIKMVMEESNQYADSFPQLLAGDFNADMTSDVIEAVKSSKWQDTFEAVHGEIEPGRTTHGFKGRNVKPGKNGRIDFIFSKGPIESKGSEIIKDDIDGVFPSDHFFIYADLMIK